MGVEVTRAKPAKLPAPEAVMLWSAGGSYFIKAFKVKRSELLRIDHTSYTGPNPTGGQFSSSVDEVRRFAHALLELIGDE